MKAEVDALRKVARVASEYLELTSSHDLDDFASRSMLLELAAALEDLRSRFPYTLTPVLSPVA